MRSSALGASDDRARLPSACDGVGRGGEAMRSTVRPPSICACRVTVLMERVGVGVVERSVQDDSSVNASDRSLISRDIRIMYCVIPSVGGVTGGIKTRR